jgi:glycosyltransferase involved in cell wall biosynthesis
MRIAHLVTGGEIAGGEVIALRLARAARGAGHDALIVAPSGGVLLDTAAAEGFATELVDVSRTVRFAGAARLSRLLRRVRVDLLHTHVHVAANVLGRLAARAAGTAVVSHLHIENHFRSQRVARAPLMGLDNASAHLCARLIAVSEATRTAFLRQGFPTGKLETIYNGVDARAIEAAPPSSLRRELGIPEDAIVIGHVGRLAPVKGQRELIEAVARLLPAHRSVRLLVVGRDLERGGAYERELARFAASLGVGAAVAFAGYRPNAAAALREVDVLALPSWIEGLPLVVLEAMAHGKPVVATAVGGTPEAVADGETGLLVQPRDVGSLAKALGTVAGDPELRRRLGEAGRRRVREHFDAAAMEGRVLEVYDEIAAAR